MRARKTPVKQIPEDSGDALLERTMCTDLYGDQVGNPRLWLRSIATFHCACRCLLTPQALHREEITTLAKHVKSPLTGRPIPQVQHYDELESIEAKSRGGTMIYMLEFLGLLTVAFSLAASPVLINVLERFFPPLNEDANAAGYGLSNSPSSDRAEVRDEIRRVTDMLEMGHLETARRGMESRNRRH